MFRCRKREMLAGIMYGRRVWADYRARSIGIQVKADEAGPKGGERWRFVGRLRLGARLKKVDCEPQTSASVRKLC